MVPQRGFLIGTSWSAKIQRHLGLRPMKIKCIPLGQLPLGPWFPRGSHGSLSRNNVIMCFTPDFSKKLTSPGVRRINLHVRVIFDHGGATQNITGTDRVCGSVRAKTARQSGRFARGWAAEAARHPSHPFSGLAELWEISRPRKVRCGSALRDDSARLRHLRRALRRIILISARGKSDGVEDRPGGAQTVGGR